MKMITIFLPVLLAQPLFAAHPSKYKDLLPYVQAAPDQGETNTCLFQASTGAMELLLNKKNRIKNPKKNGPNDLAESFLINQRDFFDPKNPSAHFIEDAVKRFNHGEAILNKFWPFVAYNSDGTDNMDVWNRHPDYVNLPRVKVPPVKTELLFARGRKYATGVLLEADVELVKETLTIRKAPVIINYNDDGYWHVVLLVGYDDKVKGDCYQIQENECNKKGAFYVRDSNGNKYEARAYNWFLLNANAAAVIELR